MAALTARIQEILQDIYSKVGGSTVVTTTPVATELDEVGEGGKIRGDFWIVHNATEASRKIAYKYQGTVFTMGGDIDTKLQVEVGNFTRDTALAGSTQEVNFTGTAFTPKAVIFIGGETATSEVCWGLDDGTNVGCTNDEEQLTVNTYAVITTYSINVRDSAGEYRGDITSLDSDGFTITWNKSSSPTGTISINYLAIG